jgi:hypothetical protein
MISGFLLGPDRRYRGLPWRQSLQRIRGEHRVQRGSAMAEETAIPLSSRGVATHIGQANLIS